MSKGASTNTPGEAEVYFSLLSAEEATKLQGLDASSKMVYQVIEGSVNKGIWTVDVRMQTNIPQTTLTKIFKVGTPLEVECTLTLISLYAFVFSVVMHAVCHLFVSN